jgi:hypothetical protein
MSGANSVVKVRGTDQEAALFGAQFPQHDLRQAEQLAHERQAQSDLTNSGQEAAVCANCDHRARFHGPGRCKARGRLWQRCKCTGFTGFDSSAPD